MNRISNQVKIKRHLKSSMLQNKRYCNQYRLQGIKAWRLFAKYNCVYSRSISFIRNKLTFICKIHSFIRGGFALIRENFAFICESYEFIRQNNSFTRESFVVVGERFALYRKLYTFIYKGFAFIRDFCSRMFFVRPSYCLSSFCILFFYILDFIFQPT